MLVCHQYDTNILQWNQFVFEQLVASLYPKSSLKCKILIGHSRVTRKKHSTYNTYSAVRLKRLNHFSPFLVWPLQKKRCFRSTIYDANKQPNKNKMIQSEFSPLFLLSIYHTQHLYDYILRKNTTNYYYTLSTHHPQQQQHKFVIKNMQEIETRISMNMNIQS